MLAFIIDDSRDLFVKEQLIIILHYVDNCGHVIERFLNITRDNNTTTPVLNMTIELVFHNMGLILANYWGKDTIELAISIELNELKIFILEK